MSYSIHIRFVGQWVLDHKEDEVLPISYMIEEIEKEFGESIELKDESITELELVLTNDKIQPDEVNTKIINIFSNHYKQENDLKNIEIEIATYEAIETKETTKEESTQDVPTKPLEESHSNTSHLEELTKEVEALVGAEDFKALIKEVCLLAPMIHENKTQDIFHQQSYLFSINEGCGLTTYLKLFSEIIQELKLREMYYGDKVLEIHLFPQQNDRPDPIEMALKIISENKKAKAQILLIDISEWMSEMNTPTFKRFLSTLDHFKSNYILAFRIPFIENEVLEKVRYSLNDLMFVKTLCFPPFSPMELQMCAKNELEKYHFKMENNAWEGFQVRLSEEKSDGKFYGMNTVKKVVHELLYKKQLYNAIKNTNDFVIHKKDTQDLCHSFVLNELSGEEELNQLVMAPQLREKIEEVISQIELSQSSLHFSTPCIHMRFVGNPGTGKTTVARIIGKILKEKGVLRIGNFFEYSGRDFCGRYVGETAPKTASMCRDAYGSVLFIDEAYSLYRGDDNSRDYGREALDTLIAEMENHRSDFVVIMAGYTDDMAKLMEGNAGLASRMPYVIEFPNFTREQLTQIYLSMLSKVKYEEEVVAMVEEYFKHLPDEIIEAKEFSNARFVRNLFERTQSKAAMRCRLQKKNVLVVTRDDFKRATSDKEFSIILQKKKRIGFDAE